MNYTAEQEAKRLVNAIPVLVGKGWEHVGSWLFHKDGRTCDFSAANLSQLDRIERDGLFTISADAVTANMKSPLEPKQ